MGKMSKKYILAKKFNIDYYQNRLDILGYPRPESRYGYTFSEILNFSNVYEIALLKRNIFGSGEWNYEMLYPAKYIYTFLEKIRIKVFKLLNFKDYKKVKWPIIAGQERKIITGKLTII
mgnify:CR=1 FL=1